MKEKDIQTIFGRHNQMEGAFELKLLNLSKHKSIRFDVVKTHQLVALDDISTEKGLFHKIADQTVGREGFFGGTLKKPFDCFYFKQMPAYIVVCVYTPRISKVFCYIDPILWVEAQRKSDKKSMNLDELRAITCNFLTV